ncbi:PIG-L deacetylase family protein [Variovorax sp. OV329]|uniref:PIG-L deacetylase family protein n=1 Tax=Variovorax sp. OV329 TaxID=1882825 RepID=UPI0008E13BA3|nr:PIG-L deacetylase family protein [Variovorax sp. OV329]SFN39800.1 N-acetylglucosaminyl deacetylase, LmbE family [Variovorax sp. OV329]
MTQEDRLIGPGDGTPEAQWLGWLSDHAMQDAALDELLCGSQRVLLVAPHPDDEVLAAGGLLAMLAAHRHDPLVIAVTDGTASHPGSTEWPAERLKRERPLESLEALTCLGLAGVNLRMQLPDGGLQAAEETLSRRLEEYLHSGDMVVTTWRHDGHPDHEATGRACARACERCGARLLEAPVWAWHWAQVNDERLPWERARRLHLDARAQAGKRDAVRAFASQLAPDPSTGAGPVLRNSTVARAMRPFEVYFV